MAVLDFSLTVGDRIAIALRKADITQTELAHTLGVSQSTVSRWINGGPVDVDALVRVAAATGQRWLLDLRDLDGDSDLGEHGSTWDHESAGQEADSLAA